MSSFPPQLPPGFNGLLTPPLVEGSALPKPASPQLAHSVLARQWSALHKAAAAVASLGGTRMAEASPEVAAFPARVERLPDWRAGLARQGVTDLAAVMEPGLTALIAVHRRGADPVPAALALMHEFTEARDALLALTRDHH
jgi:hypothetical protein